MTMSASGLETFTGPLSPPEGLRRAWVDSAVIATFQDRADRLLAAEGAGHLVHDLPVRGDGRSAAPESRPWRLDPIPAVIGSTVFDWLAAAVAERMVALEAVTADLYGARTLVGERIVPAEVLTSMPEYRLSAVGAEPRRWLTTYAVDLALSADGVWSVVQDLTDAPPGLGYALLNRSVMSRVLPDVLASTDVASLAGFTGVVRRALAAASSVESPRIVVFSGGLDHPSYIDHSFLAVHLGVNLVEGADLVVRQRRVWLRTLEGLEPVDVLYRRIADPGVDPLDVGSVGSVGVPGVLQAVRSGGVVLANAHGAGVVESPLLRPHLDDAMSRLHPAAASLPLLDDASTKLAPVPVSPSLLAPGAVATGLVVRLFAVWDGTNVSVLGGGSGRVALPGDDLRRPTACIAKDVWVLGRAGAPVVGPRLPQVDLGQSVPTRAAAALFWSNRAAERAEAMARTVRVISSRLDADPGLAMLDGGEWTRRMLGVAAGVRRFRLDDTVGAAPTVDRLRGELASLSEAVTYEIGSLLTEATTVREYLSITAGRVLARLANLRTTVRSEGAGVDDMDGLLADLAALAGLWNESTVRGPAWLIGDIARRLERGLVVVDLVEATTAPGGPAASGPERDVDAMSVEVLLAANESLVAYRRRHRSDVEPEAALGLVVNDVTNPRSLAASIAVATRHARDLDWEEGHALFGRAKSALDMPTNDGLTDVRAALDEASALLVGRWFSAPVNATLMGPAMADGAS